MSFSYSNAFGHDGWSKGPRVVYGKTPFGGRSYSKTISSQLGENTPLGKYTFVAYIGTYPDDVMDSSSAIYTRTTLEKGSLIEGKAIPDAFELSENYPNPFNPSTTIEYGLPKVTYVRLEVYNILGERVRVLRDGLQEAGYHRVVFEAEELPGGTYLCRLRAGDFVETRKLIRIR